MMKSDKLIHEKDKIAIKKKVSIQKRKRKKISDSNGHFRNWQASIEKFTLLSLFIWHYALVTVTSPLILPSRVPNSKERFTAGDHGSS